MISSRYREIAEFETATGLSLYPEEVRSYVLSTAPAEVRQQMTDRVDWAHVDLVARRVIKKVMKKFDVSEREARQIIHDTYLENFSYAEDTEEE